MADGARETGILPSTRPFFDGRPFTLRQQLSRSLHEPQAGGGAHHQMGNGIQSKSRA